MRKHARIEGKPGLQFVGDKLDEIQISLVFHQHYCVPDVELARLRTAMKAHQALALVFGNGDYRGWFVITDVTATSEQTDSTGNVLAVNATASLREYIGDPKNPLQPPAIRTQVPGVGRSPVLFLHLPGGTVRSRRRQLCQTGAVCSPDYHQRRSGGAENEG
ncbi:Phage protein U [Citrobacter koseri]|nr:Phage protein U [Citrobacter koseri]